MIKKYSVIGASILAVLVLYAVIPGSSVKELTIVEPFNEALYPPEIASPIFAWKDSVSGADSWRIRIDFSDKSSPITVSSDSTRWIPPSAVWEAVKRKTVEKKATVTISGVKKSILGKIFTRNSTLSRNSVTISTSADSVGAPIFYRDVPLPFNFAKEKMELIQWRMGDISKNERPPIVLTNLPVCGNCHSFSNDASVLAMDVDSGGDKGAYVITPTSEEIDFTPDKLITWNDYKRKEGGISFGLLARISPDGKYVACTVLDRVIFLGKEGKKLAFSQLFFPVKGIVAYYDRAIKQIKALPGADDPNFVQSNPVWSLDGKYIIFARSPISDYIKNDKTTNIVLTLAQTAVILGGEQYIEDSAHAAKFTYDLYRIPFNDGRGGKAEPVPGASDNGVSNYFPKYSPDGKWIVFCKARSFMLLQPDSKLWIMPADYSQPPRELKYNTSLMNSWHSWSPNSRWLVFSSKINSPYTELFLKHIDKDGNDSPPVRLYMFSSTDRARNIPEFVNMRQGGIKRINDRFIDDYTYVRKGDNLEQFKKYDDAEMAYRKAIELNPNSVLAHRSLALILAHGNKIDEAMKEFETVIKLDPKNPLAYQNIGEIHLARKEYEKAQKYFESALSLNPKFAPAHSGMGYLYLSKDDIKKAQANFETAVKYDPDLADAHYGLGTILMGKNELDRAQKDLEATLKAEKYERDPDVYYRLGSIALINKDTARAEKMFDTALSYDPNHAGSLHNLGIIYLQRKDLDNAEKAFMTVYQSNPDNPSVRFMLGQVYSAKDNIPKAIEMYNQGLALSPSNMQAYVELGDLYIRAGDKAGAVNALERAVQLNPRSNELKARLEKLKQM